MLIYEITMIIYNMILQEFYAHLALQLYIKMNIRTNQEITNLLYLTVGPSMFEL